MATVRRCLGCSATYPADEPACPQCGSYAGEHEEQAEPSVKSTSHKAEPKPKAKPARNRKT